MYQLQQGDNDPNLGDSDFCLTSYENYEDMAWTIPKNSKRKVNDAGDLLTGRANIDRITEDEAYDIIQNWRDAHSYPLVVQKMLLKRRAKRIDPGCNVVQRLKRLESIKNKLLLHPVKLSQMQDIGGCRVILKDIEAVKKVIAIYKKNFKDIKHELIDEYDYITTPRESGYRGHHLVYRFVGDEVKEFDGLKIEVQLRSKYQHAWATTVETVDTITKQSLKSNFVNNEWSRFFALMGSAFAIMEDCELVPNTPVSLFQLEKEIVDCERKLNVIHTLSAFNKYLQIMDKGGMIGKYYILDMNLKTQEVIIKSYYDLKKASDDYIMLERESIYDESKNIVLVSAESAESLRKAYPNYYLDTSTFVALLEAIISSYAKRKFKMPTPKSPRNKD